MEQKKRILIVNNNMHIGGVQKALVNLLREISSKYDVTLLLFYKEGLLLRDIPGNVRVIQSSPAFRTWGTTREDAAGTSHFVCRTFFALITRVFGRGMAIAIQRPFQRKLRGFDMAISFLHSGNDHVYYGGCSEFVLHCVDAESKICFLHCDYRAIRGDSPYNTKIYEKFDKIAACSEGCRQAFVSALPQLAHKTVVVHNCQDYEQVLLRSSQWDVQLPEDKMHVLTVARFGKEKGILRGIQAVAQLGEARENLQYSIIGNGTEYAKAADMIVQLGLTSTVQLLGEQENPYPYLKAADLLLIPSVSEAAPMVIGEAACLGTPILTTKTSSAEEMVTQTGYGWVCENSLEGIREGLANLIEKPELRKVRKATLAGMAFSNEEAAADFFRLIEEN